MAPMGIDLEKRDENKGARVHLGMRENEISAVAPSAGPAQLPAAIIEDVDVETAWTPAGAQTPSRAPLDALDKPQQRCGRQMCLQQEDGVEIRRLTSRSQWHGLIDAG
jgi:hypothetical protein